MIDKPDTSREAFAKLSYVLFLSGQVSAHCALGALLNERDALKAEMDAARRAALEEALNAIDQAEDADFILDRSEARGYRKSYEAIRSLADKEG